MNLSSKPLSNVDDVFFEVRNMNTFKIALLRQPSIAQNIRQEVCYGAANANLLYEKKYAMCSALAPLEQMICVKPIRVPAKKKK